MRTSISLLVLLFLSGCADPNAYNSPPEVLSDGYVAYSMMGYRDSIRDLEMPGDPGYALIAAQYLIDSAAFNLWASDSYSRFYIRLRGLRDTGVYLLSNWSIAGVLRSNVANVATDSLRTGFVHITEFDTAKKRVSGTFNFKGLDHFDSTTVQAVDSGVLFHVPFRFF